MTEVKRQLLQCLTVPRNQCHSENEEWSLEKWPYGEAKGASRGVLELLHNKEIS